MGTPIGFNQCAGVHMAHDVGYVMDKQLGNTGGLGGVYGILYAIGYGLPFPEAQPWQKSVQYDLFQRFSGATRELQKFVQGTHRREPRRPGDRDVV